MHVQAVLAVEDIEAQKEKTSEPNTEYQFTKVVQHYLKCKYTDVKDMWSKILENVVKKRTKEISLKEK